MSNFQKGQDIKKKGKTINFNFFCVLLCYLFHSFIQEYLFYFILFFLFKLEKKMNEHKVSHHSSSSCCCYYNSISFLYIFMYVFNAFKESQSIFCLVGWNKNCHSNERFSPTQKNTEKKIHPKRKMEKASWAFFCIKRTLIRTMLLFFLLYVFIASFHFFLSCVVLFIVFACSVLANNSMGRAKIVFETSLFFRFSNNKDYT